MSTTVADFLFEAANFLILALALGWVLFKPVRKALDAERARRAADEERVATMRADAEALAAEANGARAGMEAEIEKQRQQILSAARAQADEITADARAERERELETTRREVEAARAAQAEELAELIGQVAADSVRRLLAELDGPSLDLALTRGACDELRQLPDSARKAAVVECAHPVGDEERRLLRDALGADPEERTVPGLGAGVRVTTGAGQVDASALALAREAARQVTGAVHG